VGPVLGWRYFLPVLLLLLIAGAILLAPLRGPGVEGTALYPHYKDFGFFAVGPLPDHPTRSQLRQHGVMVEEPSVTARRTLAASLGAASVVALAAGELARRRRVLADGLVGGR
jgi:hypothetical protein